jgi:hypothetical protein
VKRAVPEQRSLVARGEALSLGGTDLGVLERQAIAQAMREDV